MASQTDSDYELLTEHLGYPPVVCILSLYPSLFSLVPH
jgi:hypothetical protein